MTTPENLQVIFEDNHLLVVNKRPSDIVQGDKTGDRPLSDVIKVWLKEKYQKPGNVFCGVAHRIDRPVSGVVVFAKTSKALSRLNEQFKDKTVSKEYLAAVCEPPPKDKGQLKDFLVKDSRKNKSRTVPHKGSKAKEAVLEYELLGKSDTYYFLGVKPITGRHHQIRVQLAAMGSIIKGDLKYGARRSNNDASIHLHAYRIHLVHPVRKEKITFEAPLPVDPVWNSLKSLLAAK